MLWDVTVVKSQFGYGRQITIPFDTDVFIFNVGAACRESSGRGFYWSRHVWLSHGGFKMCQCLSNTSTISWKTSDPLIAIVELKYSVTQFAWLAKDQGSISRNLVEADRTSRGPNFLFWTPQTPGTNVACRYTYRQNSHAHKIWTIFNILCHGYNSLLKSKITFSFFFVIYICYTWFSHIISVWKIYMIWVNTCSCIHAKSIHNSMYKIFTYIYIWHKSFFAEHKHS